MPPSLLPLVLGEGHGKLCSGQPRCFSLQEAPAVHSFSTMDGAAPYYAWGRTADSHEQGSLRDAAERAAQLFQSAMDTEHDFFIG